MSKALILFGVIFTSIFHLTAKGPVTWNISKERISEQEYNLVFSASVEAPWHIYAQVPNDLFEATATFFELNESESYDLVGKTTEHGKHKEKYDEFVEKNYWVYGPEVEFKQKIKVSNSPLEISGTIYYSSCNESTCLPPANHKFSISIDGTEAETLSAVSEEVPASKKSDSENPSKETVPTEDSKDSENDGLLATLLLSFGGGLLALLTPCVYPIIPLNVSFFIQGSTSKRNGIMKAIYFGLSIVFIFALIGLLAGLFKLDVNTLLRSWLMNAIFVAIFLTFAASFFGMFELVLPSKWANNADSKAEKGGFIGSFFMALATVLISFSCTGPIMAPLLLKASNGEIITPALGMAFFGMAFSLPFVLLPIFPHMVKSLPKSGGWLNSIKVFFGFLLAGFSLKFLSNIDALLHWNLISRELFLSIWIVLAFLLGIYLLGKIKFSHDSELKHVGVPRLLFAIITLTFSLYLFTGFLGAPLSPLSDFIPGPEKSTIITGSKAAVSKDIKSEICEEPKYSNLFKLPHGLNGYFQYEQGLDCAKELDKPIFLDFTGHTCTNCKRMEQKVWSKPNILGKLAKDFVIIAQYTDDRTDLNEDEYYAGQKGEQITNIGARSRDLQSQYGAPGTPFYIIVDHQGNPLVEPIIGIVDDITFEKFLIEGLDKFKSN